MSNNEYRITTRSGADAAGWAMNLSQKIADMGGTVGRLENILVVSLPEEVEAEAALLEHFTNEAIERVLRLPWKSAQVEDSAESRDPETEKEVTVDQPEQV